MLSTYQINTIFNEILPDPKNTDSQILVSVYQQYQAQRSFLILQGEKVVTALFLYQLNANRLMGI